MLISDFRFGYSFSESFFWFLVAKDFDDEDELKLDKSRVLFAYHLFIKFLNLTSYNNMITHIIIL